MEKTLKNIRGAGRKGFYDEEMVKKIINSANRIILNTLERRGKYADVDISVIIELASRFALKDIPQKIDGITFDARQIVQVYIPKYESGSEPNQVEALERSTDLIPCQ